MKAVNHFRPIAIAIRALASKEHQTAKVLKGGYVSWNSITPLLRRIVIEFTLMLMLT